MKSLSLLFLISIITLSNCALRNQNTKNTLSAQKEDTLEVKQENESGSCIPQVTIISDKSDEEYDTNEFIKIGEDPGTFFPNTDNCKIIAESGGLKEETPIYQVGNLQEGEMYVYKMEMHGAQVVNSKTSGSGDIDVFYLWDDCPFVSEDQEWVESVAYGFTDAHESVTEEVEFEAPSDGDLYIMVRAYDMGDGSLSTFSLETYCDGKKTICRELWSAVDQADHKPHVKSAEQKAQDEAMLHGHSQQHMETHHTDHENHPNHPHGEGEKEGAHDHGSHGGTESGTLDMAPIEEPGESSNDGTDDSPPMTMAPISK